MVYHRSGYAIGDPPRVFNTDGSRNVTIERGIGTIALSSLACMFRVLFLGMYRSTVRAGEMAAYATSPPGHVVDATMIGMTRSLGDLQARQFGLSEIPDVGVTSWPIDGGEEYCVVAASDGVWDTWHYDDLANLVRTQHAEGETERSLCAKIGLESVIRATSNFGADIDDVSVACILTRRYIHPRR